VLSRLNLDLPSGVCRSTAAAAKTRSGSSVARTTVAPKRNRVRSTSKDALGVEPLRCFGAALFANVGPTRAVPICSSLGPSTVDQRYAARR
jgi:hypothetical protein